jgi:hypothetical protein
MLIKSLTKVDKLTKRVENLYDQKEADEDEQKRREAREKLIREAKQWTKTDFYCARCNEDLLGCLAYKVIASDWTQKGQRLAFYEAFKACHKGLRRRITDKENDLYFTQSRMLKEQRMEAIANGDLLQPNDYGFTTKYGDPNKKKWEQLEKQEREAYAVRNN